MPALFKCYYTAKCIQDHPQKWLHLAWHLLAAFSEIVPMPSALAQISHIPESWQSKRQHNVLPSCGTTLEAISVLLLLAYMSTRLLPTKTSDSIICSWVCLPLSNPTQLAHEFRTSTKVTGFGSIPSCYICWNSSNALCPCPHFAYPRIKGRHMFLCAEHVIITTKKAILSSLINKESSSPQFLISYLLWSIYDPTTAKDLKRNSTQVPFSGLHELQTWMRKYNSQMPNPIDQCHRLQFE